MKTEIRQIQIINLGFNPWNGFHFSLFSVEINSFDGELFGLHISTNEVLIYIFFIQIEFKSPFV